LELAWAGIYTISNWAALRQMRSIARNRGTASPT